MLKQLLITFLLLGAGFNSFANGSEATSQPKPSKVILFFNLNRFREKSDEHRYLEAQCLENKRQMRMVCDQYVKNNTTESAHVDRQKRSLCNQVLEEAGKVRRAHQNPLDALRLDIEKKVQSLIEKRAIDFKAGAVLREALYVNSSNDITDYVVNEMNREYHQNEKQIYTTCDLSPFVNRMKEIGSVLKK